MRIKLWTLDSYLNVSRFAAINAISSKKRDTTVMMDIIENAAGEIIQRTVENTTHALVGYRDGVEWLESCCAIRDAVWDANKSVKSFVFMSALDAAKKRMSISYNGVEVALASCLSVMINHGKIFDIVSNLKIISNLEFDLNICFKLLSFEGTNFDQLKLTLPCQLGYYLWQVFEIIQLVSIGSVYLILSNDFWNLANRLVVKNIFRSDVIPSDLGGNLFPRDCLNLILSYDVVRSNTVVVSRLFELADMTPNTFNTNKSVHNIQYVLKS